MSAFRQGDWEASPQHPSNIEAPYLMSTGVVADEDRGLRPLSPPHSHADAMLAWCYRGTVWVHLRDAMWQLAPGQGVWIPPGIAHTAHHERESVGCYTYLPASVASVPSDGIRRVLVPRAVQEMLLHLGINDMPTDLRVRAQSVLIEMLQQPTPEALADRGEVPLPTDDRVRALAQSVLDDPGDPRDAGELCAAHGLHERTVMRIFQNDVGMSFGKWRTGVRLTLGARLILEGTPVGVAAHRCGYATTSAFSASFKERFGVSPRQHVARAQADSARRLYWR
ncbi:AraC-like DNA-binding protein [Microbacterium sp. SORGH_AS 1204]|uniref:helix-turn-helix transcriptional regulator n=1 Tax=Microbacterium sp. SORGH_AS_1204 TaxID=3041785 RepID=UPI002791C459|nr:AraC family transcriptional regulator [Microbacterium sp. SORGH_AS_1204]MDQ1135900.1 AraC-like DNA-binding protein [Microbacterium sp. SORGH_AS_1204]